MVKKVKGFEIRRGVVKEVSLFVTRADATREIAEREGIAGYYYGNGAIHQVKTVVQRGKVYHHAKDGQSFTWGQAYPTRAQCKASVVKSMVGNVKTYAKRLTAAKRVVAKARRL